MSDNTSKSERPMIRCKKLSSEIEHKTKRQKQVGHTNAAVIKYETLNDWIEQAKYLEAQANDPEEAGREKSDLMRWLVVKHDKTIQDIERQHIDSILTIMEGENCTAQTINRTPDGNFVSVVYKVEKYQLPDDDYDYVEYGIYVTEDLSVKRVRNWVKGNGTQVEYRDLPNHHKITRYMAKEGFNVFCD